MKIFDYNTVENLVLILASVFIFSAIPRFPYLGNFFNLNPFVIIFVAVIMIMYKQNIAKLITKTSMLDTYTSTNIVLIIASVFIFSAIPAIPYFNSFFNIYPGIVIIVAIILIMFKNKIAKAIGG